MFSASSLPYCPQELPCTQHSGIWRRGCTAREKESSACCHLLENSDEVKRAQKPQWLWINPRPQATGLIRGSCPSFFYCGPHPHRPQVPNSSNSLANMTHSTGLDLGPLLLSCQPAKRTPAFHSLQGKCEFFPWGCNLCLGHNPSPCLLSRHLLT